MLYDKRNKSFYMTDIMKFDIPFKADDYGICTDDKLFDSGASVREICYRDPDEGSDLLYKQINSKFTFVRAKKCTVSLM